MDYLILLVAWVAVTIKVMLEGKSRLRLFVLITWILFFTLPAISLWLITIPFNLYDDPMRTLSITAIIYAIFSLFTTVWINKRFYLNKETFLWRILGLLSSVFYIVILKGVIINIM